MKEAEELGLFCLLGQYTISWIWPSISIWSFCFTGFHKNGTQYRAGLLLDSQKLVVNFESHRQTIIESHFYDPL